MQVRAWGRGTAPGVSLGSIQDGTNGWHDDDDDDDTTYKLEAVPSEKTTWRV